MSKETLSVKQANKIIEEMNSIIKQCGVAAERANDEFIGKLSNIWEDQKAVEFAKTHKRILDNAITNLNKNNNAYAETVKNIADSYTTVGNITEKVSATASTIIANIDVSRVKEHFSNSTNSDDFGFINPETGPDEVMSAFEDYSRQLSRIAADTTNKINSINAFGNTDVKLALASSGAKVIEILLDGADKQKKSLSEVIKEFARKYLHLGQEASEDADSSSGTETSRPNQVLYGPAPGPSGGGEVHRVEPNQVLYGPAPGPSGGEVHRVEPNQVLYGPAPSGEIHYVGPKDED